MFIVSRIESPMCDRAKELSDTMMYRWIATENKSSAYCSPSGKVVLSVDFILL